MTSPVYGSMSCNSHPQRDGTTCSFKCSQDFYLKGSKSITCNNHQWSGSKPSCEKKVKCQYVSSLAHGNILGCSNPPLTQEVCTYKCHPGYQLEGPQHLKCSISTEMTYLRGQRIGSLPYCRPLLTFRGCRNANGGCSHECKQDTFQTRSWCVCPPGWTLKDDKRTCEEEDECKTGKNHCQQKCYNTALGYRCGCENGYHLIDRHHCEDVNECVIGNHRCQHTCVNTVPGYRCECRHGYRLIDEFHCVAMNSDDDVAQQQHVDRSCGVKNGDCDHKCSQGSYGTIICSCHPGFKLEKNGKSCVDIDECATNNYGCSHQCKNFMGSARCLCPTGHRLSWNKKTCLALGRGTVVPKRNTPDHSLQEPHVDHSGISCVLRNGGCAQKCSEEADGKVTCSCNAGFKLGVDGKSCLDIDECAVNNYGCSHLCQNLRGSAKCLCREGYKLSEDKKTCLDIDECAFQQLNKCEHKCHNTEGSYSCSCEEGYLLFKDFKCQACRLHSYWSSLDSSCKECPPHSYTLAEGQTSIADCICRPGFTGEPAQNKTCIDIDECLDDNFGCSHDCLNSLGSVMCTCPKGFKLGEDIKTCKDIDECNVKNGGCHDTCHNVEGGFYCSCPKGFLLTNAYFCTDINECEENNGNCSDICINIPGGFHCGCPSGFHVDHGGEKCRALLCPKFVVPNNAKVQCFPKDDKSRKITLGIGEKVVEEEMKFPPNTICKAVCKKGYTKMDTRSDSIVACDDEGNWNASINLGCQVLQCPPLSIEDPVMQVHPPECSQKPMTVLSECHMSCPANYRLKGKPRFTCNKSLQWKPDTLPACSPVNSFLTCPEDITLSLRNFNDTSALVVLPPPETNLAYMVKHRPDWIAINTPTLFPLGKTKVTFTINEPRLNLKLTCNVFISVIDDVSPVFDYCPESFQVEAEDSFNGVQVTWREPVAYDNVDIHSILKTLEPNTTLIPGVHNVKYVAKDAAGNEAECAFEINVQASSFECGELEDPLNGEANCMELLSGVFCDPICNENYIWSKEPLEPYTCDSTGKWSPSKIIPPCVPECEEGAVWSEVLQHCEFQFIDLGKNPE